MDLPRGRTLSARHITKLSRCVSTAAVRARWTVHARFGHKSETAELLREWVYSIASQAGGDLQAASISLGSIGVPESEIQVDLDFASMSKFDEFMHTLPQQQHRAWLQRMQGKICDQQGTPAWSVLHTVPCDLDNASTTTPPATAHATEPSPGSQTVLSQRAMTCNTADSTSSSQQALIDALTADLNHPATTPPPSLLDLPVSDLKGGSSSGLVTATLADVDSSEGVATPGAAPEPVKRSKRAGRSRGGPIRVGGGIKIPAGGAPAGSRLAAMVGDDDYYNDEKQDNEKI